MLARLYRLRLQLRLHQPVPAIPTRTRWVKRPSDLLVARIIEWTILGTAAVGVGVVPAMAVAQGTTGSRTRG